MATADIARTVVGIIGNIISGCLFLSPVPTFVQIWKKGSVEQYSRLPYLATLMNCMVWTLYGLPMVHPHSLLVVTINGAGCVVEIIYITFFLIHSDRPKRIKVFLCLLLELAFSGATNFVCNELQVNKAADSSNECETGSESIRSGGRQQRQQQQEKDRCCSQCSLI